MLGARERLGLVVRTEDRSKTVGFRYRPEKIVDKVLELSVQRVLDFI
jgi:hypothetical protein